MGKFYLKKAALAAVVALFALGGVNEAYADDVTATLVHTVGTQWGSNTGSNTIDSEKEHYNNDAATGWAGCAFAEFSFNLPEGATVTGATLKWSATNGRSGGRNNDLYYLSPTYTFDAATEQSSTGAHRHTGERTKITSVSGTGYNGTYYTIETDVADAVKAVVNASKSTVVFMWTGNPAGADLAGKASEKAPTLTITYSTAAAVSYTVKFQDENGISIKDDETRSSAAGEAVSATDDDKATFYNSNKSQKYVFSSVTGEGTLAEGTETTIILTFKTYGQYTATLTSVYGTNSVQKTVTAYEDETATIYYPAYVKDEEGVYFGIAANETTPTYGVTFTATDKEKTITYAKDETVAYFAEYEDLCSKSYSQYKVEESSNGKSTILSSSGTVTTNMSATKDGTYEVTVRGFNRDATANHTTNLNVYLASDTETPVYTSSTIRGGSSMANYTFNITLKSGEELYIPDDQGSGNARFAGDYILVKKIDAPTVTINATSKLASYSNASAVTVPSGVVIYKAATPADGSVVLTKVEGSVIPANTGVILYSETTGKRELTYGGTSTGDFTDNALKATGNSTVAAGDNYYALVAGQQAIAKVKSGVEIPANKAYLEYTAPTTTETEAKLSVVFDGTVTAIESVTTNDTNGTNAIYNLSGQRVSKSYKGVVVKNGKKYINK